MFFGFNLKSSVLLVFFLHGIVFSILLFIKALQTQHRSGYWLGLFTLLCSMYIAPFLFGYAGWYGNAFYRDILFYIPFQQLLLFGPVLFFYFQTLLDSSFRFSSKDYFHFIPALCYLLYAVVIFVTDKVILGEYYFYSDGRDKDFSLWYQVAGVLSLIFYLIQSLRTYYTYKRITYSVTSFADSVMFKWAKRFLLAFLLLIATRLLFFVLNPEWAQFGKKFWYYLCFSILFYYMSISGYANSVLSVTSFKDFESGADVEPVNEADTVHKKLSTTESQLADSSPGTGHEIADLETWKQKVETLMLVDKMYENPDLVISDLAQKLNTHSKKISQVINQGFEMNFNDLINTYRVKALLQKIEEGEHSVQTLLSLAFECGFNSKSTFNRAFKRVTSLNPKEYIAKRSHQ